MFVPFMPWLEDSSPCSTASAVTLIMGQVQNDAGEFILHDAGFGAGQGVKEADTCTAPWSVEVLHVVWVEVI